MLEECWKPALARHLTPRHTGMRIDRDPFLHDDNFDRAPNGLRTQGRDPAETSQSRSGHDLVTLVASPHRTLSGRASAGETSSLP